MRNKQEGISFKSVTYLNVYLDGKNIGRIVIVPGGYQYQPKKAKSSQFGEVFRSVRDCQNSLL